MNITQSQPKTTVRNHKFTFVPGATSVSKLLRAVQVPFDEIGKSEEMAETSEFTAEELQQQWKVKAAKGRRTGSIVHEYIAKTLKNQKTIGMETLSTRLPHMDQFDQFWKKACQTYDVLWVENTISSFFYQAHGRVDTLFQHKTERTYHVVDWKTGTFSSEGWNYLLSPFEDLKDSTPAVSSIQASIYNLIIRRELKYQMGEGYVIHIGQDNFTINALNVDLQSRVDRWLKRIAGRTLAGFPCQ